MFRTKLENDIKQAEKQQLKRCKTTTNYTPDMGIVDMSDPNRFFTFRDKDCHTATEALIKLQQELKLK